MTAAQPKRELIEYVRYDGKANPNKVGRCTADKAFWGSGRRLLGLVGCVSGEVKFVGQTPVYPYKHVHILYVGNAELRFCDKCLKKFIEDVAALKVRLPGRGKK